MSQTVNWGILGTASVARRRFVPAAARARNARVLAIASRSPESARCFAKELDIPEHYGSYEALLADPRLEAVYIPLPNHLHCEWTLKAAQAGKHVLCEKPMAADADEARAMADACRANGVLLMEGFMYRFNPRTAALRKAIDDGLLGEVKSAVVQFSFLLGTRQTYRDDSRMIPGKGAGSLTDLGCYCINFARFVFGGTPESVTAAQRIDEATGGDLSTEAVLDFGSGRTAVIVCSFETAYRNAVTVAGEQAVLTADRFFTPLAEGKTEFSIRPSHGEPEVFTFEAVDQFLLEIEHFSSCVLGGLQPLLAPFEDAVPNAAVIDAVRESARAGRAAKVRL